MPAANEAARPSDHQRLGQVTRAYQAQYPDPIAVQAGERLEVSAKIDHWNGNPAWVWVWCSDPRGKSGWVPQNLIETRSQTAVARDDYSAVELTANVGETLSIEGAESGWLWCANQHGQRGWIPADHMQPLGD